MLLNKVICGCVLIGCMALLMLSAEATVSKNLEEAKRCYLNHDLKLALHFAKLELVSNPRSSPALQIAAKSKEESGDVKGALDYSAKLCSLYPKPHHLILHATYLAEAGKTDEALKLTNQILAIDKNYAPAYLLRTQIFRNREGASPRTITEFKKAENCKFEDVAFKQDLDAVKKSLESNTR